MKSKQKRRHEGWYIDPKLSPLNLLSHHSSVRRATFCEWGALGVNNLHLSEEVPARNQVLSQTLLSWAETGPEEPWAVLREEPQER